MMTQSWRDLAFICCPAEYRTQDQYSHADENWLQLPGAQRPPSEGATLRQAACRHPRAVMQAWHPDPVTPSASGNDELWQ